jgi:hypothetical protein
MGGSQPGSDQSCVGAAEKERGTKAGIGDAVAMRAGNALDQTMKPQPPQVVGHLALAELFGRQTEQRGEVLAQVLVGETPR